MTRRPAWLPSAPDTTPNTAMILATFAWTAAASPRPPARAPCATVCRRDSSRGGCPARSDAHRSSWPRSPTQALGGPGKGSWAVRQRCRRWLRSGPPGWSSAGGAGGAHPLGSDGASRPMRRPTPCPPCDLLRLMPWPSRAPSGGGGGGGVRAASCVAVRRGRCSSWSQAGGGAAPVDPVRIPS